MTETLVSADAEVAVKDELNLRMPELDYSGEWGTRVPREPKPDEFGRVLNTGGGQRDLVTDSPTIVVEAFATSETTAQRMCAFAVASLQSAGRAGSVGGIPCYGVSVLSLPANLPMPSMPDRFRFTATLSVDLRRSAV